MVVLSNPGTYGTRKCSSWCAEIHKSKDPDYKHPEIQNSKNPKRFRRCEKVLDFWIFRFLDFRSRCLITVLDKLVKCAFRASGGG